MKKLIYIFLNLIFILTIQKVKAQNGLPLHQGSIVMTHSPFQGNCLNNKNFSSTNLNGSVVRILNAQNTSNIPINSGNKYVWTNFNTANPKPMWYSDTSWNGHNLGRVFGITLDEIGNIYVANTSIFGGELVKNNTIFKLDKNTGAISIVYNLPNTDNNKGIGNIKIFKIGTINYMAATNWDDGKIYILKQPMGGLTSNANWLFVDAIKPTLLSSIGMPYGVAVKPNTTGTFDVYYGVYEINSTTDHNSRINKIEINSSGNFIMGTELAINIPIITQPNLVMNTSISVYTNTPFPISDISFSSDYKKVVLGQQALNYTNIYQAHNSRAQEFIENTPNNWISISKLPSGNTNYSDAFSAVGGVSYWNNILFKNNELKCDTSVIYSCDLIYIGIDSNYTSIFVPLQEVSAPSNNFGNSKTQFDISIYGFQGLPSNNNYTTLINAFNASLKVDADDIYTQCDKWSLGDIEAFNVTCLPPCICGKWDKVGFNNNANWWIPDNSPMPSALSFEHGSVSGVLFPHYNCEGTCAATFKFEIANDNGQAINLMGSNSLDLNQQLIKNLKCGSYNIIITPICGNSKCPRLIIPIVIKCLPPCSDCGGNASVTSSSSPSINNGIISSNFSLTNSKPLSEVRVLVEEFRVTSKLENCLLCNNPPKSWGSIISASLGSIAPSLNNYGTVDNREAIFNNNGTLPLPANLDIKLALPQSAKISCCEVDVDICLKFILRDVFCCEKEVLKCFTLKLPQ